MSESLETIRDAAEQEAIAYVDKWLSDLSEQRAALEAEFEENKEYLSDANIASVGFDARGGDMDAAATVMELQHEKKRYETEIAANNLLTTFVREVQEELRSEGSFSIQNHIDGVIKRERQAYMQHYDDDMFRMAIEENSPDLRKFGADLNDLFYMMERMNQHAVQPTTLDDSMIDAIIIALVKHENEAIAEWKSKGFEYSQEPWVGEPLDHPMAERWRSAFNDLSEHMPNSGSLMRAESWWATYCENLTDNIVSELRETVSFKRYSEEGSVAERADNITDNINYLELALVGLDLADGMSPHKHEIQSAIRNQAEIIPYIGKEEEGRNLNKEPRLSQTVHYVMDSVNSVIEICGSEAQTQIDTIKSELIAKRDALKSELYSFSPADIAKARTLDKLLVSKQETIEEISEYTQYLELNKELNRVFDKSVGEYARVREKIVDLEMNSWAIRQLNYGGTLRTKKGLMKAIEKEISVSNQRLNKIQKEEDALNGINRNPLIDLLSKTKEILGVGGSEESKSSDYALMKSITWAVAITSLAVGAEVAIDNGVVGDLTNMLSSAEVFTSVDPSNVVDAVQSFNVDNMNLDDAVINNIEGLKGDENISLSDVIQDVTTVPEGDTPKPELPSFM